MVKTKNKISARKKARIKAIRKKIGRPTKYKPSYCKDIIKYFSKPLMRTIVTKHRYKKGKKTKVSIHKQEVVNDMPFMSGYARHIDIEQKTLDNWCKEHPEFLQAYRRARALQKEFLVQHALQGNYNSNFSIFTAKNILGWRDKQDIEHMGKNAGPVRFLIEHVSKNGKKPR